MNCCNGFCPQLTPIRPSLQPIDAIRQLSDTTDVEPVLRRFERAFAAALGFDFAWDLATDSGQSVEPGPGVLL